MSNGGTPKGDKPAEQPSDEPRAADDGSESHLLPGDTYHHDKQLLADLSSLNGQISRYVLRYLDAEAKRGVPTTPDDERALATRIIQVGEALEARAKSRITTAESTVLNGAVTHPRLLEPGNSHTGDMDNGP